MSTIAAAADTILQDGREVCIIRAHQLLAGDTVVQFEKINLPVVDVRLYEKRGWVTAGYSSVVGYDERSYAWTQLIAILPRTYEDGH